MTGRLEGKVAFITGIARGQGRSHAVRLAEEGADIIGVDLLEDVPLIPYAGGTQADMDETVRQVEALDRRIIAAKVDIRDEAAMQAFVDSSVAELGGRLDIVSANAGISGPMMPTIELDHEAWAQMIDINLTGQWITTKVAAPHMIAAGNGGSIVLTSSGASLRANANIAHYSAAKAGVVSLMQTLAKELGPHSIRVNSVHPTQVETPMIMHDAQIKIFRPDLENPTEDDFAEASRSLHVLPIPWVQSVDISNAIVFLSSEEGRYITGVQLPIDAGGSL
ncbi:mycofactocin-coupled SDR family oxidoreductase [Georgenia sp. Z1344]|uniref:mycofactocin-coupled SDR family oxidoreductase n=1 Tax=Georgenia sp. Z1344 TaxID=3416706 RepID=UPI003CE8026D